MLTLTDEQNPKKLKFSENQPELLINDLKDPSVDLALINGNFILKAGPEHRERPRCGVRGEQPVRELPGLARGFQG